MKVKSQKFTNIPVDILPDIVLRAANELAVLEITRVLILPIANVVAPGRTAHHACVTRAPFITPCNSIPHTGYFKARFLEFDVIAYEFVNRLLLEKTVHGGAGGHSWTGYKYK